MTPFVVILFLALGIQGATSENDVSGNDCFVPAVCNKHGYSETAWMSISRPVCEADIAMKGVQGEMGLKGESGSVGLKGEDGPQGENGQPGPKGDNGTRGIKGSKGDVGVIGPKGENGSQGKVGQPGSKGENGSRGEKGSNGEIGEKGIMGDIGPKGEPASVDSLAIGNMTKEIELLKKKNAEMEMEKDAEDIIKRSFEQAVVALARSPSTREAVCYMGMKSGQIPDSAITSSSDWNADHSARLGRLDNQPSGSEKGMWAAKLNRVGEWIQVDLGHPEVVAGVVTQGRPVYSPNQWVPSYKVSCGNVENSMTTITEHGRDKVFSANTDRDTKVVNKFPQLMTCRYIRIYPQTYHTHMSMRLEIIRGICKDIY